MNKKSFKIYFENYASMTINSKTFSEQKPLYLNVISDKDMKSFKGAKVHKIKILDNEDKCRLFKVKTSKGDFILEYKEK